MSDVPVPFRSLAPWRLFDRRYSYLAVNMRLEILKLFEERR